MRWFSRIWLGMVVGCLPLLAVGLVPQLMRSRAGSEALVAVGTVLTLVLLVAAFVVAPVIAAVVAPSPPRWLPRSAPSAVRRVWGCRRAAAWRALLAAFAIYALGQAAAFGLAVLLPHFVADPSGGWTLRYGPYAVQATLIYVVTCASLTLYATRVRTLALEQDALDIAAG